MKHLLTHLLLTFIIILRSEKASSQIPADKITDPVCGITVTKSEAFDWKYAHHTYYFHSYSCMHSFKMNPQQFHLAKCIANTISTDPVCGMKVNKAESYDLRYKGILYFFDSYECRETFLSNPEKFLNNKCDSLHTHP